MTSLRSLAGLPLFGILSDSAPYQRRRTRRIFSLHPEA
ncbi:hypothetical protein SMF913_10103 [Streptomyces malaysiensis]|uniref:Uncharacterized protein n=1 Tax=Streptomyces malaysiensis TaxID=92644 RepID=A0A2J7Z1C6_STRMQ|nr:hypothetical protein SMF913_10103 [Streptomyces malaysiensis]